METQQYHCVVSLMSQALYKLPETIVGWYTHSRGGSRVNNYNDIDIGFNLHLLISRQALEDIYYCILNIRNILHVYCCGEENKFLTLL